MKHSITLVVSMLFALHAAAMSSTPPADPIVEYQKSWAAKALAQQRNIDLNAPLASNNIIGTHNSYNATVYADATRYIDPQHVHSIYDQLRLGARFIELDVHWTAHTHGLPWEWGADLLLCHSGIGASMGDLHVGCSTTDRRVSEGLQEIAKWTSENPKEVLIVYLEDHSEGRHQELLNLLNSNLGAKIYASQGCKNLPTNLTKAQILAAGKQIVIWKDSGCSNNAAMQNLVFTGLNMNRVWEDRTAIGTIAALVNDGAVKQMTAADIAQAFRQGTHLVNLDNLTYNDSRLEGAVWSWDVGEPNNYNNSQHCALQRATGRWDDADCSSQYHFACADQNGNWRVSSWAGKWQEGSTACAQLGGNYRFSTPTNSRANEALKAAKGGITHVWLNASDRAQEGTWVAH